MSARLLRRRRRPARGESDAGARLVAGRADRLDLPAAFGTGAGALAAQLSTRRRRCRLRPTCEQALAQDDVRGVPERRSRAALGLVVGQPDAQRHARLDRRAGTDELPGVSRRSIRSSTCITATSTGSGRCGRLDGHADEYPTSGGEAVSQPQRHDVSVGREAPPATARTPPIASAIPMPDVSAVGVKRNVDTLDYRGAFGYTYDTMAVDRHGPRPHRQHDRHHAGPDEDAAPDRHQVGGRKARGVGVPAGLRNRAAERQLTYVIAGVKTFRQLGAGNDFTPCSRRRATAWSSRARRFSRAAFDSAAAAMSPGGRYAAGRRVASTSTTRSCEPPFGGRPGRRAALPGDAHRRLARPPARR